MLKIIVDWHENYCQVNPESDIFEDLSVTMWEGCSKEAVEESIKNELKNIPYDIYNNLLELTEIKHNFLI